MSGKEMIRALLIGAAFAIVANGWRGYVGAALIIGAFLLTDWIAEDEVEKQIRAHSLRLASTLRRGGIR